MKTNSARAKVIAVYRRIPDTPGRRYVRLPVDACNILPAVQPEYSGITAKDRYVTAFSYGCDIKVETRAANERGLVVARALENKIPTWK